MSRGYIVARGNGHRLTVRLGKDPNRPGRYLRITEQINGPHSKDRAEKRVTQILADYDKGVYVFTGKETTAEYLIDWLKTNAKARLSPGTLQDYSIMIHKHIIPAIGNIKLIRLTKEQVLTMYNSMRDEGKTRAITYCHAILHKALKDAIPDKIVRNVAGEAGTPNYDKKEFKPMTPAEVHILLEFTRDTEYYPLWYTYLFTAARRNELIALRWSDVDKEYKQIIINRTVEYVDAELIYKKPKTEKSKAPITLTPSNAAILKEHRANMVLQRQKLDLPELTTDDLVFCQLDGSSYLPDTITHVWMRLAKKLGLSGIRLHDTRHTHASLLIADGVDIAAVSERLRHSRKSTTLDVYTHLLPGKNKEVADKFDNILMPKPKEPEANPKP